MWLEFVWRLLCICTLPSSFYAVHGVADNIYMGILGISGIQRRLRRKNTLLQTSPSSTVSRDHGEALLSVPTAGSPGLGLVLQLLYFLNAKYQYKNPFEKDIKSTKTKPFYFFFFLSVRAYTPRLSESHRQKGPPPKRANAESSFTVAFRFLAFSSVYFLLTLLFLPLPLLTLFLLFTSCLLFHLLPLFIRQEVFGSAQVSRQVHW